MKEEDVKKIIVNIEKQIEDYDKQIAKTGSPLKTEDITNDIMPLLTEKGKAMVNGPSVKQLMKINGNGEVEYVVRYFGVTTALKSTGVLKMSKIINELAEKYNSVGILAPPIQLQLNIHDPSSPTIATIFYVAFAPNEGVLVERNEFIITEGEMPRDYMETTEDLEEVEKNGLMDKLDRND